MKVVSCPFGVAFLYLSGFTRFRPNRVIPDNHCRKPRSSRNRVIPEGACFSRNLVSAVQLSSIIRYCRVPESLILPPKIPDFPRCQIRNIPDSGILFISSSPCCLFRILPGSGILFSFRNSTIH
jgi:hypothetical protein